MKFITAPVAQMTFAAFLDAETAIARQLREYVFLLHLALFFDVVAW